jgi:hypothetical protein
MTGPEHYREAEELVLRAQTATSGRRVERWYTDTAQVHATLALAADPIGRIARAVDEINALEHGNFIDTYAASRLREALGETGGAR